MKLGDEQVESHLKESNVEKLDCLVSDEWLEDFLELKSCVTVSPDEDLMISKLSLMHKHKAE